MTATPDPRLPDPTRPPVEDPLNYLARLEAMAALLMEPCPACGRVPQPIGLRDGIVVAVAVIHEDSCPYQPGEE